MPVYEYYCSKCRTRFEAMRSMRDADAPIACEQCGNKKAARVLSMFNASSGGKAVGGGGGCSTCGGGSCSSCGVSRN